MYSNLRKYFLWVSIGLNLVGCSLPLGEKPTEPKAPSVDVLSNKTACLTEVLPIMADFMKGQSELNQVTGAWDCFSSAIDVFTKNTRGKSSDRYTGREIANFFEQIYFSEDVRINDQLLLQIMKIKVLLVGGSTEDITKVELNKLQSFASLMRRLSTELHPYMKVYSQNWKLNPKTDLDQSDFFNKSEIQLEKSLSEMAQFIALNPGAYDIGDFVDLLNQIQSLYKEKWGMVQAMQSGLPAIYKVKSIFVGGDDHKISEKEWAVFFRFASKGYAQYLRYVYFIQPLDQWLSEINRSVLLEFLDKVGDFAIDVLSTKQDQRVRVGDLIDVFDLAQQAIPSLTGSRDLVFKAIKLKTFILGGSPDYLSVQELENLKQNLPTFLNLTYFMQPSVRWLDEQNLKKSIETISDFFIGVLATRSDKEIDVNEIQTLLETIGSTISEVPIHRELIVEILQLKKVFLGGSSEFLSSNDFQSLKIRIDILQNIVVQLHSVSSFLKGSYVFSSSMVEARSEFSIKESELKALVDLVSQQIQSGYDVNRLINLAQQIDLHFPQPESPLLPKAQKLVEYLAVFRALVSADSKADNGILTAQDLRSLLKLGAEGLSRWNFYSYLVKPFADRSEARVRYYSSLRSLLLDSDNLIKLVLSQTPQGFISFSRLNQALKEFKVFELAGLEKLPIERREQLLKLLVSRILVKPADRLAGVVKINIDIQTISYLNEEINSWLSGQIWLASILASYGSSLTTVVDLDSLLRQVRGLPEGPAKKELLLAFESSASMVLDASGRVIIDYYNRPYDWASLNQMNLVRMASRIVISSYSKEMSRVYGNKGLNLVEVKEFVGHVMPVLNSLGVIPSKPNTFADDRFRDANLFMPRSDGNDWLSFQESVDILSSLLSGAKSDQLYKRDLEQNCQSTPHPSQPKQVYQLNCFLSHISANWANSISNIPFYVRFLKGLDLKSRANFIFNQTKSAGYVLNRSQTIDSSDIGLVPQIAQYVEWLVKKYDTNRDGLLTKNEAMVAYPIFKSILSLASGQTSETRLRGLFSYLLKNGKAPETLLEKADYMAWTYLQGESSWSFEVDRQKFADILGCIADALEKAKSSTPAWIDLEHE